MNCGHCLNIENYYFSKLFIVNNLRLSILIIVLVISASCSNRGKSGFTPVRYVQKILNDTSSREYSILSTYNNKDISGSIAIIGETSDVLKMADDLKTCDRHNNVSGKLKSDGLPDFSGETISAFFDDANCELYKQPLKYPDSLRTVTTRNFMAAIDTVYYENPYDKELRMNKKRAKIVILSSLMSSIYGEKDIDTLCRKTGAGIPVFSALNSALKRVSKDSSDVLIWTKTDTLAACLNKNISCIAIGACITGNPIERFKNLLDKYLATGNNKRMSSIIIDNSFINSDSLRTVIDSLYNVNEYNENVIHYRHVLSKEVKIIDPCRTVAEDVYNYLRNTNGFTHRIQYPEIQMYTSEQSKDIAPYVYIPVR